MDNFVLGRYLPNDSIIHDLDPRAKILGMLILIIAIFIPGGAIGYGVLALIILDCIYLSKLKLSYIWKAMKPMLFMLAFLLVVNVLVVKTGEQLTTILGVAIYSGAIQQTLFIIVRLTFMITITTILTSTTKPLDLTLGIEDLLIPFKKIGVPAHIIAMMISIALRFIPTLVEEAQRIMKAQASRGVDLEEGKFKEKIKCILSLIVPLFISAFQRAEELANAMEARGYAPDRTRTRYKKLKMTIKDYCALSLCMCVFVVTICASLYYATL